MKLTKAQVSHTAKLANLPLTPKEEERCSSQLSEILEYVGQLDKVDTKGVQPTYNVTDKNNVTGEDVPNKSLSQEEALQNASGTQGGYFVTKGIFAEEVMDV